MSENSVEPTQNGLDKSHRDSPEDNQVIESMGSRSDFIRTLRANQINFSREALIETLKTKSRDTQIGTILDDLKADGGMQDIFLTLTIQELIDSMMSGSPKFASPETSVQDREEIDQDKVYPPHIKQAKFFSDEDEEEEEEEEIELQDEDEYPESDASEVAQDSPDVNDVEDASSLYKDLAGFMKSNALGKSNKMSLAEISKEFGSDKELVRMTLTTLIEDKKVAKDGVARGTKYFFKTKSGKKSGKNSGKKKSGKKKSPPR